MTRPGKRKTLGWKRLGEFQEAACTPLGGDGSPHIVTQEPPDKSGGKNQRRV